MSEKPVYFAVSLSKFATLSVATFGLYRLYWFYQNWKLERERTGEKLSPQARTVFAPLFSFSLFKRIKAEVRKAGAGTMPSSGLLALGYIVWASTWRLPDPYWLVCLLSFVPFLPVQAGVNRLNRHVAPNAPRNDGYSGANVAVIIIGTIFLALVILGVAMNLQQAAPPATVPATV